MDVAIIGGGPAGVQAAISAVTEGFRTALIEPGAIGGQIAQTPHLENMVGYVYGVNGSSLSRTMEDQLYRLGVKVIEDRVTDVLLRPNDKHRFAIYLRGGGSIQARVVVLATGRRFKDLPIKGMSHPEVKLGPASVFRFDSRGQEVVVVGGGNSAGQAIVYLGERADKVHVIAPSLNTSQYLTDRIHANPKVDVWLGARLVHIEKNGDDDLIVTARGEGGTIVNHACRVFVCAGVEPNVEFLDKDMLEFDEDGLVLTGLDFQTHTPGLFAIGDVRSGAVNRVPSAIGEGSNVQPHLWRFLQ